MNISIKKTAIAAILITGIAGALSLQANELSDSQNKGVGGDRNAAMPMGMQNVQGMGGMMNMMGMSGQMGEMMSACAKMMAVHIDNENRSTEQDEPRG